MIGWTVLNALWWGASIYFGFWRNIDLNPYLTNTGEVVLNAVVFLAGLGFIYLTMKDKEDDDGVIEADFTEEEDEPEEEQGTEGTQGTEDTENEKEESDGAKKD